MDSKARDRVERQFRPHLFEDCGWCGEEGVKIRGHVCDPVRKMTWDEFRKHPEPEPNFSMVTHLEERLLAVLMRHKIVLSSEQLRDLALAVEPSTRGPYASAASGD